MFIPHTRNLSALLPILLYNLIQASSNKCPEGVADYIVQLAFSQQGKQLHEFNRHRREHAGSANVTNAFFTGIKEPERDEEQDVLQKQQCHHFSGFFSRQHAPDFPEELRPEYPMGVRRAVEQGHPQHEPHVHQE